MTTLELQAELAKKIFNIENEEILNKLSGVLKRLTDKPAVMQGSPTEKEINARADRVLSAFRNGETDRFVSHEDLKKKHVQHEI
jgi:hypothetical protein